MIGNNNLNDTDNLESQLSKLDRQLLSFKIADRQGINRGIVKDVYNDFGGELNLLLELKDTNNQISLLRLGSQDIRQVDVANKLITSSLSNQQLEELPIYQPVTPYTKDVLGKSSEYNNGGMNPDLDLARKSNDSETISISLLEEKLQVARRKQKVGEVVVRKEVETRIVEVPLRREKLVIERVGKDPQKLTEVITNEEKVSGFGYDELNDERNHLHVSHSQYLTLEDAQSILQAITHLSNPDQPKIRLEIVTTNPDLQQQYQDVCDRQVQ